MNVRSLILSALILSTTACLADEVPPDQKAILAASQIMVSRYHVGSGITPIDSDTALAGTRAKIVRSPDKPCTFEMFDAGGIIEARIDFDRLRDEYSVAQDGYGNQQLIVPGAGTAVCDRVDVKLDAGHLHCWNRYVAVTAPQVVTIAVRAFRFIFSNVCRPLDSLN
jgi:hypothetical protein